MEIREVSILSDDAQNLIGALDQELSKEYTQEEMQALDYGSFTGIGGVFAVGYEDQTPVACGGLRPINDADVELKRLFVTSTHRCEGLGRKILAYLESKAETLGYKRILLETGDVQEAAIHLYSALGFTRIEPYGEYAESGRSVCFEKRLPKSD